jgi:hypothetical protein
MPTPLPLVPTLENIYFYPPVLLFFSLSVYC